MPLSICQWGLEKVEGCKQKLIKELDSVSAVTLSETGIIHIVVANISPMKPDKDVSATTVTDKLWRAVNMNS